MEGRDDHLAGAPVYITVDSSIQTSIHLHLHFTGEPPAIVLHRHGGENERQGQAIEGEGGLLS